MNAKLFQQLHEQYEERAAIMQYDAGLLRADAERLAILDVFGPFESDDRKCK